MRLRGTDLDVSPIGYGTAALGRSLSGRERRRLLETALDCGVTHFDTAPLYGAGAAEQAVGRFCRGIRDRVTVATKVGIRPPSPARLAAGRLTRRPAGATGGLFAPDEVRASLEGSLLRLQTSYVDLLLLHEVAAAAVDDALLDTLEAIVGRGDARAVGIATNREQTAALLEREAAFPAVVQIAAADAAAAGDRAMILHSTIVGRTGSPGDLVCATRNRFPDALVLFGSRSAAHVRETADRAYARQPPAAPR